MICASADKYEDEHIYLKDKYIDTANEPKSMNAHTLASC